MASSLKETGKLPPGLLHCSPRQKQNAKSWSPPKVGGGSPGQNEGSVVGVRVGSGLEGVLIRDFGNRVLILRDFFSLSHYGLQTGMIDFLLLHFP